MGRVKSNVKEDEVNNGAIWCKCPKCQGKHRVWFKKMFDAEWTGRGTPRVFCDLCRSLIAYWRDRADAVGAVLVENPKMEEGE